MKIKVDKKKCCWKNGKCSSCSCGGACVGCVEACPVQAIIRGKSSVTIDYKKCIPCGACVSVCKHNALSLE